MKGRRMSEQQSTAQSQAQSQAQVTVEQHHPAPAAHKTWNDYWTNEHHQPWRTEPEIDWQRQQYLAKRLTIQADIEHGAYPFKDVKLDRADVEWLLAAHDNTRGPVDWDDPTQRRRMGLDVRGANLAGVSLRSLPLARLNGGLGFTERLRATREQREAAAAHLEGADLIYTHLEGAWLCGAHLQGAVCRHAHLEGALLDDARLDGANLREAFLDASTTLVDVTLASKEYGYVSFVDVRWGGVNLALVNWAQVALLGNEWRARAARSRDGRRKPPSARVYEFEQAVRANLQLAVALRAQGLNQTADRFAYRAQALQRHVLRRQLQYVRAVGSLLLDLISGYGYRPLRSFITYALVVLGFAGAYLFLAGANSQTLSWNEAIVISMTAFHGRGFFQSAFHPGDLQAAVAAIEAFIGLLIEIVLIATFTQRFFAR
jgi:uncharacterized protein YjbI with pentapeptide repeats